MSSKGKFIVIEGIDGTGKTTQTVLLIDKLREDGRPVMTVSFPQYDETFFGALVGRYLKGEFGSNDSVHPVLASVLFALDRWQGKESITRALDDGFTVIANRYAFSNKGHQGSKVPPNEREELIRFLHRMEYEVLGIPEEDMNIVLSMDPEIAQALVDKKGQRGYLGGQKRDIHEGDIKHLRNAHDTYHLLAEIFPEKVTLIDCLNDKGELMTPQSINEQVYKVASRVINGSTLEGQYQSKERK